MYGSSQPTISRRIENVTCDGKRSILIGLFLLIDNCPDVMCLYLYIYIYNCMFVSALPDPTCNSEKSANGGNKQILLLLL